MKIKVVIEGNWSNEAINEVMNDPRSLEKYDDYKVLIVPDHATPLCLKTHTNDPIPFLMYHKKGEVKGCDEFTEETAKATGDYVENGHELMQMFINM